LAASTVITCNKFIVNTTRLLEPWSALCCLLKIFASHDICANPRSSRNVMLASRGCGCVRTNIISWFSLPSRSSGLSLRETLFEHCFSVLAAKALTDWCWERSSSHDRSHASFCCWNLFEVRQDWCGYRKHACCLYTIS
jgi:hypothetical protein